MCPFLLDHYKVLMLFNKITKITSSYVTSFNGASRFRGDDLWPDFRKWYIRIEDSNDSDGDGVPDISDQIDNSNKYHLSSLPILLLE
jgi:hypothetical protein